MMIMGHQREIDDFGHMSSTLYCFYMQTNKRKFRYNFNIIICIIGQCLPTIFHVTKSRHVQVITRNRMTSLSKTELPYTS